MAEVILVSRKAEHQHFFSTYCSRTKPTAVANATIRAENVTSFNNSSGGYNFQLTLNKPTAESFCFAKENMWFDM